MAEIHYNDIGTALRATILDENGAAIDISDASVLTLKLKKPDGTVLSKTASLTNDGSDGILEYVTVDGDLNQIGSWVIQGFVTLPSGSWHSDLHEFKVYRNLS